MNAVILPRNQCAARPTNIDDVNQISPATEQPFGIVNDQRRVRVIDEAVQSRTGQLSASVGAGRQKLQNTAGSRFPDIGVCAGELQER